MHSPLSIGMSIPGAQFKVLKDQVGLNTVTGCQIKTPFGTQRSVTWMMPKQDKLTRLNYKQCKLRQRPGDESLCELIFYTC